MSQVQLVGPPTDGISSLNFAPTSDLLLVTSWDTVRAAERVACDRAHYFRAASAWQWLAVPCWQPSNASAQSHKSFVSVLFQGVRLYDARANTGPQSYYHHRAAVLDGALADDTTAYSGGLDNTVTK